MRSLARTCVVLLLLLTLIGADRPADVAPAPKRSVERFAWLIQKQNELIRDLSAADMPALNDLRAQIDREAAQKDASHSRLFWYTNLDDSLAEAKRTGKPVLSLRMHGRLDEELSCANSRFFRKMLYVDPAVGDLMRERFVLHWESLRPVPTITIDFGDGRTVKRTITGNSIHYVLLADGRPIDAIPGLVDASTFAAVLESVATFASSRPSDTDLASYWKRTIEAPPQAPRAPGVNGPVTGFGPITVSKGAAEYSTLAAVRNPSDAVRADTEINMQQLRPRILGFLAAGAGKDLPTLNKRVYAELFKSPLDDPDMGLNPPDEMAIFCK